MCGFCSGTTRARNALLPTEREGKLELQDSARGFRSLSEDGSPCGLIPEHLCPSFMTQKQVTGRQLQKSVCV